MQMSKELTWFIAGTLFAVLWASASTATKIGLSVAQPLVIAEVRFVLAAFIMLFVTHFVLKHRLPVGKEWKQLMIYGFLNITVYLGLYVLAMQNITAGIGALAVASNPVFITANKPSRRSSPKLPTKSSSPGPPYNLSFPESPIS